MVTGYTNAPSPAISQKGSTSLHKTITLSTAEDWAMSLICEDILREAYKRIGYNLQVKKYPASRAIYYSSQGAVDGELSRIAGLSKKYPELIQIKVPTLTSTIHAFSLMEDLDAPTYESIIDYSIGIQVGYIKINKATESFTDVSKNAKVESLLKCWK